MFEFLNESKNKFFDEESMDGLKNFIFLLCVAGGACVFMAFVAFWLSHR